VRITCDLAKRDWTLRERGLDLLRAKDVFAGPHFTRTGRPPRLRRAALHHRRPAGFALCRPGLDAARRRKTHHQHEVLP
jgi:hypothetical protein